MSATDRVWAHAQRLPWSARPSQASVRVATRLLREPFELEAVHRLPLSVSSDIVMVLTDRQFILATDQVGERWQSLAAQFPATTGHADLVVLPRELIVTMTVSDTGVAWGLTNGTTVQLVAARGVRNSYSMSNPGGQELGATAVTISAGRQSGGSVAGPAHGIPPPPPPAAPLRSSPASDSSRPASRTGSAAGPPPEDRSRPRMPPPVPGTRPVPLPPPGAMPRPNRGPLPADWPEDLPPLELPEPPPR